mgnify:FL=1
MKTTFTKLGLKAKKVATSCQINDNISLEIRQYLPIDEKANLI